MEKNYKVSDYMSTRGVTVKKNTTFAEAVRIMIAEKTNGLVVTNGNNEVIGILSSWDMIKHVVPDYLEKEGNLSAFESGQVFVDRIAEVSADTIEKFMTKNVRTASATDTIIEAAAMLAEHGIRQLPVVDDKGAFIGYINRTDIKRAIGDVLVSSSDK